MLQKIKLSLVFWLFAVLSINQLYAQSPPQGISYQAVARDSEGLVLGDANLLVQVGILLNAPDGNIMWEEEHSANTNEFGLFTLVIGEGTSTGVGLSPTFALINWGGASYFLSIEVDSGLGYELMGISQLLSVPYAFHADTANSALTADDVDDADADPQNELITSMEMENDSLVIVEGGNTHYLDIGEALNESTGCLNSIQLVGDTLNIIDYCGDANLVDLGPLVDDGDWEVGDGFMFSSQENVGVGTNNPTSSLHVNGSVAYANTVVTGTVGVLLDGNNNVIIANVSQGIVTANLPSAIDCPGRVYRFKVFFTGDTPSTMSILPSGGQTIDGMNSLSDIAPSNPPFAIMSDGSNWWIIEGSIQ